MKRIGRYDVPLNLYFETAYISQNDGWLLYIFKSNRENKYLFEFYKKEYNALYIQQNDIYSNTFIQARVEHDKSIMKIDRINFFFIDVKNNFIVELLTTNKSGNYIIKYTDKHTSKIKKINLKQEIAILTKFDTYLTMSKNNPLKINSHKISTIFNIKRRDL